LTNLVNEKIYTIIGHSKYDWLVFLDDDKTTPHSLTLFIPYIEPKGNTTMRTSTDLDYVSRTNRMIQVMDSATRGVKIEKSLKGCQQWKLVENPKWNWVDCDYREYVPAEDEIDWSHVNPKYKYLVRDTNGTPWLYTEYPVYGKDGWTTRVPCELPPLNATMFASYKKGPRLNKEVWQQRPTIIKK
jgi:hypothetical protein